MAHGVTVAAPEAEPVTLAEAKAQCRVADDYTADDGLIEGLVAAARDLAERHTGRLLAGGRAAAVALARFPAGAEPIRLPVEPVSAVASVAYAATDGTTVTLTGPDCQTALTFSPPLVAPAAGECWPDTLAGALAPVTVTLTAGGACPERARQAILLAVGYWYAHRGDGGDPERRGLPPAALRLLDLTDTGGYR